MCDLIYFLFSRHISSALLILLVFIISIVSVQHLNQQVFSQGDSDPPMIMSNSENSEESITSYYDALIKAPLLVSQCTIVGIVFSQLVLSRIFYMLSRKNLIARIIYGNSTSKIKNIVLCVILICGSINIISNGIVSHNAATEFLPWLAISADWLHVMAVSIWLGGLFYISLILLRAIRTSSSYLAHGGELDTTHEQIVARNSFSLALMLPSFSMIAVICLGVIGVSGLYMAWIQLQSTQSLFDSLYGNILILKLCVIAPMIALGGYHQIKLHLVMVQIAQRANKSPEQLSVSSNVNRGTRYDPFIRFSKTIKVEALIGIAVLVISSFLTITSPPSMVHSGMQIQMEGSRSANNNPGVFGTEDHSEIIPEFTDGFNIAASGLGCIVFISSVFYYRKSKRELKTTLDLLKPR